MFDKGKPIAGRKARYIDDDIRANNEAIEAAVGFGHDFATGSTQTGEHNDGAAKIYAGDTAPTTKEDGITVLNADDVGKRLWLDTSVTPNVLKVLTAIGTLNTWTSIAQLMGMLDEDDMASDSDELPATQQSIKAYADAIAAFTVPTGTVLPFAGASADRPSGWLTCNGAAVSRTDYADLFAVIGTTYGAGDGSTTFNVPDLRGRTVVGQGTGTAPDRSFKALGEADGTETHTLTVNEMPAHNHALRSANQTSYSLSNGTGPFGNTNASNTKQETANIANAGSGQAHNNMQPYLVLTYIIRT